MDLANLAALAEKLDRFQQEISRLNQNIERHAPRIEALLQQFAENKNIPRLVQELHVLNQILLSIGKVSGTAGVVSSIINTVLKRTKTAR